MTARMPAWEMRRPRRGMKEVSLVTVVMMLFPRMVLGENRSVATSIHRPAIRIGRVTVDWIAIRVTVIWFDASA